MAAKTRYQEQIASYWDPDLPGSFFQWDKRLHNCSKKIEGLRLKAIANLQRNIPLALGEEENVFRGVLEELRKIEDDVSPAIQLSIDAYGTAVRSKTYLAGDYAAFDKRLDDLNADIRKVYKDSLYPFLLVLQNAKSGWNPSTLICSAWDYYSWWHVKDPKAEIDKVYRK